MTKFYLLRHGSNDFLGKGIAGRQPGVSLNQEGRCQAERLAEKLARESIDLICSSPMERCLETAAPLSRRLRIQIEISPSFNEVDFGDWTGRSLEELRQLDAWKQWNSYRSGCQIPNGETIIRVQTRMVGELQRLAATYPGKRIAVFSHGDPIRSVLCYYLGIPLDLLTRMEVSPASINILSLAEHGPQIIRINECV